MLPSHLVPCPSCSRHVRAREDTCPFCRDALPDAVRASAPPRRLVGRLPRAALFAVGAGAAAIAAAACGESAQPLYGGVCDPPSCDGYPDDASTVLADASVVRLDASDDGASIHDAADASDASAALTDASDGGPPLDSGSDADDGD